MNHVWKNVNKYGEEKNMNALKEHLLAPTGALIVMMCYYITVPPLAKTTLSQTVDRKSPSG